MSLKKRTGKSYIVIKLQVLYNEYYFLKLVIVIDVIINYLLPPFSMPTTRSVSI